MISADVMASRVTCHHINNRRDYMRFILFFLVKRLTSPSPMSQVTSLNQFPSFSLSHCITQLTHILDKGKINIMEINLRIIQFKTLSLIGLIRIFVTRLLNYPLVFCLMRSQFLFLSKSKSSFNIWL